MEPGNDLETLSGFTYLRGVRVGARAPGGLTDSPGLGVRNFRLGPSTSLPIRSVSTSY
jgi:hypothetical protein